MVSNSAKFESLDLVVVVAVVRANTMCIVRVVISKDVTFVRMVVFEAIEIPTVIGRILDGEHFESRASVFVDLA
jgi:hypothetical protein